MRKPWASTGSEAQALLDQQLAFCELALICNHELIARVNCIQSWDCETAYSSDARLHLAFARIRISFELFEQYDPIAEHPLPPQAVPFEGVDLHADLSNVFDASGRYSSPFPPAISLPPRSTGPDGRDEGCIKMNLGD